jgi:hypothetical protein
MRKPMVDAEENVAGLRGSSVDISLWVWEPQNERFIAVAILESPGLRVVGTGAIIGKHEKDESSIRANLKIEADLSTHHFWHSYSTWSRHLIACSCCGYALW